MGRRNLGLNTNLNIRIEKELLEQLREHSIKLGVDVSSFIRELIKKALEK